MEDLQERISEASGAEGEIMALVSRKAKEWEVCGWEVCVYVCVCVCRWVGGVCVHHLKRAPSKHSENHGLLEHKVLHW